MLLSSGVGRTDLATVSEQAGGLGLFIRSIVGLERGAAAEAFAGYMDGTRFNVDQIRFVDLIIDELNAQRSGRPRAAVRVALHRSSP